MFDLNLPEYDPLNHLYGMKEDVRNWTDSDASKSVKFGSPYSVAIKDIFMSSNNNKPDADYKYKFIG